MVVASPGENPGLVSDCVVLLTVEAALAADAALNWDADVPITEWQGVTIGGEPPRVHELSGGGFNWRWQPHIADRNIPAELGGLTELRRLSLADSEWSLRRLTGPIPASLGELRKLEVLDLRHNALTGEIPAALGSLQDLQVLRLNGNRLSGPIPAALGALTSLQALHLDGNELTGPIPAQLGALASLETLSLQDNRLTGPIPAALGALSSLQALFLGRNELTGSIPPELGALANLETLSLQENRLTGQIPAALDALGSLEHLFLNGNQLSDRVPWELTSFSVREWTGIPGWVGTYPRVGEGDTLTRCLPPVSPPMPRKTGREPYKPVCTPAEVCENGTVVANAAANPGLVNDCIALLTAETGLAGDDEPFREPALNWNAATAITAWGGVTVAGTPARVRAIDLDWAGLAGRIEPQLSWLSALEQLRLAGNALSGMIPVSLAELPKLELLSLSGNVDLTGCIPWALREVRDHDLDGVGLPDCPSPVPPSELCTNNTAVPRPTDNPGLVKDCVVLLTAKDTLAGSAILNWDASMPIAEWEGITIGGTPGRVQAVELRRRGLTGQIPAELSDLSKLRSLDLTGNYLTGLTGAIPGALGALASLERLSLSLNRLSGEIPAELGSLHQLEYLSLVGNDLNGRDPRGTGKPSQPGVPVAGVEPADRSDPGRTGSPR